MSFRVRSSKFRHVFGNAYKKESCYEGIVASKNAHDNSFCAVNPKFLSVITESAGGGSFVVQPLEKVGRVDINIPKVCGHTGPILDIKWNPFNDNVIASASEDSTVKLWQIPDGGLENTINDWIVDLHGHTRRVGYIDWHPTAENVLLSAGYDFNCILWNVETAEPVNIISVHQENIFSIAWNQDGSLFATTCKDKKMRVVDPRLANVVSECDSHQGTKASKVTFLGNKNKLFTTGSSKRSERQYAIWDMRNMSSPIRMDEIDSSSGVMFLFYDPDTNVVFLAGKGDGNIRYFEVVDSDPYVHFLSQYQSSSPQRGLGFMPKRGIDTSKCEIVRFYKLHTTKPLVEPVSMIVPRKSEVFQEDIYPPTASAVASLSADEWIAGSNREPILLSLKDRQILATPKSHTAKAVQRKTEREVNNNRPPRKLTVVNSQPRKLIVHSSTTPPSILTSDHQPRKITILRSSQVSQKKSSSVNQNKMRTSNNISKVSSHTSRVPNGTKTVGMSAVSTVTKAPRSVTIETTGPVMTRSRNKHRNNVNSLETMVGNKVNTVGNHGVVGKEVTSGKGYGVTRGSVRQLRNNFYQTTSKDGGIVPTITTYKAVKRGQSMVEPTTNDAKRNSPLTKSLSLDQPPERSQNIPASVRNIAKLSSLEDVNELPPTTTSKSGDHVDVQNRIGMFENKNHHPTPPASPEKHRWTTQYHNTVKTEVTSPTGEGPQENNEESHSPTTHQPLLSSTTNTSHMMSSSIAHHHPDQSTDYTRQQSGRTRGNTRTKLSIVSTSSMDPDQLSDSDGLISPVSPLINPQKFSKKKHGYSHAYRRRRENKILNESSDMETFTTPPTSPANGHFEGGASTAAMASWNENPLFSEEAAASSAPVDISALDDALHDFEELSKTFVQNTDSVNSRSQAGSQSQINTSMAAQNRAKSMKTKREREIIRSKPEVSKTGEREISRSKPDVSKTGEREISRSKQDVSKTSEWEISRSKPDVSKTGGYSAQNDSKFMSSNSTTNYELSSYTSLSSGHIPTSSINSGPIHTNSFSSGHIASNGAVLGRSSPVGSESREMIDIMSTEAPDNTLIKPSKLRASLRSKRRHTQEITMRDEREPSPGVQNNSTAWSNFTRGASFREKPLLADEKDESPLRRVNSLRDHSRSKEVIMIEKGPPLEQNKKELNNNKTMNGGVSPTQVSRPLQLALDMDTHSTQDTSNKAYSAQRQDSFKSSTKVQLHSPSPAKSPVQMYPQQKGHSPSPVVSPLQMYPQQKVHSPSPVMSPVQTYSQQKATSTIYSTRARSQSPKVVENQTGKLLFTTTSVNDKNPDKFLFSPLDGSTAFTQQADSFRYGRRGSSNTNMDDPENLSTSQKLDSPVNYVSRKIHVKKVWSPRSPSQTEPSFVYENGDTSAHLPSTDPELRKAYFRQLEEIESLKQQITVKDKRIRQLEEELTMLRVSPVVDESTC